MRPAKAYAPQIQLPEAELNRLKVRIAHDFESAKGDHQERMRRFAAAYRRWRGRTDKVEVDPQTGRERFLVPLTQWQVYAKLAKENAALFGDDAEVVAVPVGPCDQAAVRKVGRYQTWRLFSSMRIKNDANVFNFRKVLFGRAHAYRPWVRETYSVPQEDGSTAEEVLYDGPKFIPLWPDDLIVPAESAACSIHDFSWVIRRYPVTPDELLDKEGTLYQAITENFKQIVSWSADARQRDEADWVKDEKDFAEGVLYENPQSARESLRCWEWYGKWRMLKGGKSAEEDNLDAREPRTTELVVRYLPDLDLIVGVQRLDQMYPKQQKRRPFSEASLVKDGSYWGPSYGEVLEKLERMMSNTQNLTDDAVAFNVSPMMFYKPASGFDPDNFVARPGLGVACDDPNGVKVVLMQADLQAGIMQKQEILSYAERVTGLSDMAMGRAIDRPNAPKTARQTLALLEEGDVRGSLELSGLREDWSQIITEFWELDSMYAPPEVFFRVTEEEAGGLFDIAQGGAYMTAAERGGKYDFTLKFATSTWSRETQKQNQLALYQLDLQNPLVATNPRALWVATDKVHRAMGDDRFSDLIPKPPDLGLPVDPAEEHTKALQGDVIAVNPLDNDQLHILKHQEQLDRMRANPHRDDQAFFILTRHALDHIAQMRQKQMMQAMAASLADSMAQSTAIGRGLTNQQGPVPLTNLHAMLGEMIAPAEGDPNAEAA